MGKCHGLNPGTPIESTVKYVLSFDQDLGSRKKNNPPSLGTYVAERELSLGLVAEEATQ